MIINLLKTETFRYTKCFGHHLFPAQEAYSQPSRPVANL
jgi:hypothetical protein